MLGSVTNKVCAAEVPSPPRADISAGGLMVQIQSMMMPRIRKQHQVVSDVDLSSFLPRPEPELA